MEAMQFLLSPNLQAVPELVHGFGLRVSGPRSVARDAARATLRPVGDVFFLRQVHGCAVVQPPWSEPPDADASWSDEPATLLAIETADCLPILLVDPDLHRVAAVHAGWRGTAAGVARHAVRTLVEKGSDPSRLLASLGPSIGPCCYEVGLDVEDAFGSAGSRFFVGGPGPKRHLDVKAANRSQLEEAGVRLSSMDQQDPCTRCRADLFYSYRRDGANAGRMISFVGFSRQPSA